MRREAADPYTAERSIRGHISTMAKTVQDMSNELLDGGLVCKSSTQVSIGESTHNELRRLLWLSREDVRREAWHFSILIATSSVAGLAAGLITALAAMAVEYRNTHGDVQQDKTLTPREVRNDCIIAAVATWFTTIAADIVSDTRARRERRRFNNAFPAAIFVTRMRDALNALKQADEDNAAALVSVVP